MGPHNWHIGDGGRRSLLSHVCDETDCTFTPPDPFSLLPTADLERMRQSAWWEAARAWQEYRTAARNDPDADLVPVLWDAVESAESYYKRLDRELTERKS